MEYVGLGGIDHQFIPCLVQELLLAIGTMGEIVPNTKNWNGREAAGSPIYNLGNITDAIFTSGFMALDLYYTLSRSEFSIQQLRELKEMTKTLQVHMMRLFSLKQAMIKSKKPYKGIKLHMLIHFIDSITWWGAPKVFDMIRFEKAHRKFAKLPFKKISKRLATIMEEMMNRLNRGRLIDMLYRLSDIDIESIVPKRLRVFDHSRLMGTESDIIFQPGYNSSPQTLYYNVTSDSFEVLNKRIHNDEYHMHPFLNLNKISDLLESDQCPDKWSVVLDDCKAGIGGHQILLHKCIKYDGEVQGIPVGHIYCSTTEEYGGSRNGKRFDWVELNMGDGVDSETYPTTFAQVCAILELRSPGKSFSNAYCIT
jgi:hypothetical protein